MNIMNIMKSIGPMPEPCTTDRLMDNWERWKPSLVACVRSLRKDMIHWIMNTGTCKRYSLRARITWSTMSNALVKSVSTVHCLLSASIILSSYNNVMRQHVRITNLILWLRFVIKSLLLFLVPKQVLMSEVFLKKKAEKCTFDKDLNYTCILLVYY